MQTEQFRWTDEAGWQGGFPGHLGKSAQLVLVFGGRELLLQRQCFDEISAAYPSAKIFGCSTAGEICDTQVLENSLSIAAIKFDSTTISTVRAKHSEFKNSYEAGTAIGKMLLNDKLSHVFVLSTSINVNGSALMRGITHVLPDGVELSGGIASNYEVVGETAVVCDAIPDNNSAVAIGFYGDQLSVGCASVGGWDAFGPERMITKSHENVLYELDGKSALDLYKKYLGEHAGGLPATALFFPMCLRPPESTGIVVRSITSVNEKDQSLISGGDLPVGHYARMMLGNYDHLVEGAEDAAKICSGIIGNQGPDLAIVVSCVARKMVLRQKVEEETEAVREMLGERPVITGFYSLGEIAPIASGTPCEFHNQSMTITVFREN
ncbi:MAG: FIST N-terminal domain-containing protein [Armatimonadota bacterium]|nr:FIST C-terminal domain-containing protein [bacterium]